MIFEETEDGMSIHISHKDLMLMDKERFINIIVYGRNIYRRHNADADLDHDDSKEI